MVVMYLLHWLWAMAVVGEFGGCSPCPSSDAVMLMLNGSIKLGVVLCSVTGWGSQSCAHQQLLSWHTPCRSDQCREEHVAYLLPVHQLCWDAAVPVLGNLRMPFRDYPGMWL